MSSTRWIGEHVVEGDLAFRIGRDGDDLVAEWIDLCELRSDRKGQRVSFVAREGADARSVAKVEAGLAAALIRHLRGGTSVHASAVARGGRAVAFFGKSGAGKSTTAAWLCRQRGFALLADDVVRLELEKEQARVVAYPTEAEHWLEPQSRRALGLSDADVEGKTPSAASVVEREPVALRAALSLALSPAPGGRPDDRAGRSEGPSLVKLRGHRAIEALLPCLVRFVLDEPDVQIAELGRLESLVRSISLYELRAPRDFGTLPRLADLVEGLLNERCDDR